ncbi:hypothetical protein K502DRAFT_344746 [Neoconidiobolus thromboides FSU 785]|nr:hypothetical protein K502DRAFT_344746 [Neoconidiobolus thromboides FSU 785]
MVNKIHYGYSELPTINEKEEDALMIYLKSIGHEALYPTISKVFKDVTPNKIQNTLKEVNQFICQEQNNKKGLRASLDNMKNKLLKPIKKKLSLDHITSNYQEVKSLSNANNCTKRIPNGSLSITSSYGPLSPETLSAPNTPLTKELSSPNLSFIQSPTSLNESVNLCIIQDQSNFNSPYLTSPTSVKYSLEEARKRLNRS